MWKKINHDIIYGRLISLNLHGVPEENEDKISSRYPVSGLIF
jgi:hypothetical protein